MKTKIVVSQHSDVVRIVKGTLLQKIELLDDNLQTVPLLKLQSSLLKAIRYSISEDFVTQGVAGGFRIFEKESNSVSDDGLYLEIVELRLKTK